MPTTRIAPFWSTVLLGLLSFTYVAILQRSEPDTKSANNTTIATGVDRNALEEVSNTIPRGAKEEEGSHDKTLADAGAFQSDVADGNEDDDDAIIDDWDWHRMNEVYPPETRPCPHTEPNFLAMGKNITVYSKTRNDRSGCVIQHMLQVYAYTWKYGFTYSGGTTEVFSVLVRMRKRHEELFKTIGLDGIFWFNDPEEMVQNYFLMAGPRCYGDIRLDDPEFLDHLRSIKQIAEVSPSPSALLRPSRKKNVAIHIRRGDANPCLGLEPRLKRYLPNAYYRRVLDYYVGDDPDVEVTIFSEEESFESFDEFRQLGYELQLDGPMSDAWIAMMNADILITSPESLFSYIPAIFNPNIVYHDKPGFHWHVVSDNILQESEVVKNSLIQERCQDFIKKHSCLEENKYPPYKDCTAEEEAERSSRMRRRGV